MSKGRRFGPGLLVTAAFIGPGTVTTATRAGAAFGFALLWAVGFAIVATIFLQEMSARLGLVTRQGLGEAVRSTFRQRFMRFLSCVLVAAAIGFGNAAYQTGNITGAKWTKLIANTMTMGPHGLLGLRNGEAAVLPGMADIAARIGRESLAVGSALGYRIEPIFGLRADEFAGTSDENLATTRNALMQHVGSRSRTAPIHDHIKGRKSEMEFITGVVCRKGRELGIPTPYNDAVLEIDRMINKGEIRMERSNFERLKERIAR